MAKKLTASEELEYVSEQLAGNRHQIAQLAVNRHELDEEFLSEKDAYDGKVKVIRNDHRKLVKLVIGLQNREAELKVQIEKEKAEELEKAKKEGKVDKIGGDPPPSGSLASNPPGMPGSVTPPVNPTDINEYAKSKQEGPAKI